MITDVTQRVFRVSTPEQRARWAPMIEARTSKTVGCWLWMGPTNSFGHGMFYAERQCRLAHRLAWEIAHVADVPVGLYVCHACDVPRCVRPDHLFVGTPKDNSQDMVSKGRCRPSGTHGEDLPQHKLTELDVTEIRRMLADGASHAALGRRFGVTKQNIRAIAIGRTWKHLLPPGAVNAS